GPTSFVTLQLSENTNNFDSRVDNNLSARDQLFGRVSYSRQAAFIPGALSGDANNTGFGQGNITDRSLNFGVSETHTFSSTLINEARFGYSRLRSSAQPPTALTSGIPANYGIQGIPQTSENGGLPTIS